MKTATKKTKVKTKADELIEQIPWRQTRPGIQEAVIPDTHLILKDGTIFTCLNRRQNKVMWADGKESESALLTLEHFVQYYQENPEERGPARNFFFYSRMTREVLERGTPATTSGVREAILGTKDTPFGFLDKLNYEHRKLLGKAEAALEALAKCEAHLTNADGTVIDTDHALTLALVRGALGALEPERVNNE